MSEAIYIDDEPLSSFGGQLADWNFEKDITNSILTGKNYVLPSLLRSDVAQGTLTATIHVTGRNTADAHLKASRLVCRLNKTAELQMPDGMLYRSALSKCSETEFTDWIIELSLEFTAVPHGAYMSIDPYVAGTPIHYNGTAPAGVKIEFDAPNDIQNITLSIIKNLEKKSGTSVKFSDAAELYQLLMSGNTTQDGTGDATPDNIRQIHGVSYAEKWEGFLAVGRNLIPSVNFNALAALSSDATIAGEQPDKNGWNRAKLLTTGSAGSTFRIRDVVHSNGTYSFSIWLKSTAPSTATGEIDICDNHNTTYSVTDSWTRIKIEGETVHNYTSSLYNFVDIFLDANSSVYCCYPKLENGTVATDYSPAPEDYPSYQKTMLPRELFDGDSYDLVTGQGTAAKKKTVFDGSDDESWCMGTADGRIYFSIDIEKAANAEAGGTIDFLCSHFNVHYFQNTGAIVYIAGYGNRAFFYSADTSITSISAWKSFLAAQAAAGTPVTILYQLAASQQITGTPIPFTVSANALVSADNGGTVTTTSGNTKQEVQLVSIPAGAHIILDGINCKITQNGVNKFSDSNLVDFPCFDSFGGTYTIQTSEAASNLKIGYYPARL